MFQIRIHGRGGQGVVTAAEIIAISAFKSGHFAQAFPAFGVERTGAPIESYVRIDNQKIITKEQINNPDILIIQDSSLLFLNIIYRGTNREVKIIINTTKTPQEILNIIKNNGGDLLLENIYTIDATKIALKILNKNIVNTIILGAFAQTTKLIELNALKQAIQEKFTEKEKFIVDKNIQAIEMAYYNLNKI